MTPDLLYPLPDQAIGELLIMTGGAETRPPDINKPWLMYRHSANNTRPTPSLFYWDIDSDLWLSEPMQIIGPFGVSGQTTGTTSRLFEFLRGPVLDYGYSGLDIANANWQFMMSIDSSGSGVESCTYNFNFASGAASVVFSTPRIASAIDYGPFATGAGHIETGAWENVPLTINANDFLSVSIANPTPSGGGTFTRHIVAFARVAITPV